MTISINRTLSQESLTFSKNSICNTMENLVQEFIKNPLLKSGYQSLIQNSGLKDEQISEKLNAFLTDQNLMHNYLFIVNQLDSVKSIFDSRFRLRINNLVKLYLLSVFYKHNHLKPLSQ